jgi:phosphate starvation-inducible protein PhoH
MTANQERVFQSTKNQVLHGCAGTGKTFISSFLAYRGLLSGKHTKLIYIRSAVSTRPIGHLPGTEAEKVSVYEAPYNAIATELFGRSDAYEYLKKKDLVEFKSTSFARGITIKNAAVIVDECQNMDFHELDTIMTRFGEGTRYFFCGDFRQSDLRDNGLKKFFAILKDLNKDFDCTEFQEEDIVRHELVKRYIIARNKHEDSQGKS